MSTPEAQPRSRAAICETLRLIADALADEEADAETPTTDDNGWRVTPQQVRRMISARRKRAHFFGEGLFGEPAWDILLDLYVTHLSGGRVVVTSLCIAADVPSTTALRWIGVLCERGMLRRWKDPDDGRRVYVELTGTAVRALENYFAAFAASELLRMP